MRAILNEIQQLTCKKLQDAKQIWKNTQAMQTYIDQEEVESLIQAIELRQNWMEQSEDSGGKINRRLKILYEKYQVESIEALDQDLYPEVEKVVLNKREIEDLYTKCYELEKQNQVKAKHLLKEYKEEMIRIQQGKQANQVYGRQSTGQSLLLNKIS